MVKKSARNRNQSKERGKRDRRGSVGKTVKEPISEKVMFECRSQRREGVTGEYLEEERAAALSYRGA